MAKTLIILERKTDMAAWMREYVPRFETAANVSQASMVANFYGLWALSQMPSRIRADGSSRPL